tara:strand:+ start:161 stop:346 length:186 start_codon:yes stop_codon:yes gene_type:complete
MDHYTVIRLGLILAVQAEIEGMKADNLVDSYTLYVEGHFTEKAEELRQICSANDHQLDKMG